MAAGERFRRLEVPPRAVEIDQHAQRVGVLEMLLAERVLDNRRRLTISLLGLVPTTHGLVQGREVGQAAGDGWVVRAGRRPVDLQRLAVHLLRPGVAPHTLIHAGQRGEVRGGFGVVRASRRADHVQGALSQQLRRGVIGQHRYAIDRLTRSAAWAGWAEPSTDSLISRTCRSSGAAAT